MIKRLLNQKAVVFERLISSSPDANLVNYGNGVTVECRVQNYSTTFKNQQYQEFKFDLEMWVLPFVQIKEGDKVEIDNISYLVEKIQIKRSRDGAIHHKKLLLFKNA